SPTIEEIVEESPVLASPTVEEIITLPTTNIQTENITLPPTKTSSEEELIQQISAIGSSGNFGSTNILTGYLQHSNPQVRYAVASTLGKLTASGRLSREVQQSIPLLTRLSQDIDPSVRQEAIIALGKIPSHQVIPILQKALRDPQISVAQSASIALNKFKVYRVQPKSQPKSLMLRKPNISSNPK
ncbi:MAG: HEAT repeat domain-containing protein, partial [Planktothrix rubescens PR222]